jgi:hypothetical protein
VNDEIKYNPYTSHTSFSGAIHNEKLRQSVPYIPIQAPYRENIMICLVAMVQPTNLHKKQND